MPDADRTRKNSDVKLPGYRAVWGCVSSKRRPVENPNLKESEGSKNND